LECERSGSYTKVPDFFPHMKSPLSAINPNAIKILNKTWISVPQGSETNFKIKAKNAYEENLFKVNSLVWQILYSFLLSRVKMKDMNSILSSIIVQLLSNG